MSNDAIWAIELNAQKEWEVTLDLENKSVWVASFKDLTDAQAFVEQKEASPGEARSYFVHDLLEFM